MDDKIGDCMSYLFIGGSHDGERVNILHAHHHPQFWMHNKTTLAEVGVCNHRPSREPSGSEIYLRQELRWGEGSTYIYFHESILPRERFHFLISGYRNPSNKGAEQ